jgi:hypothetical protein
MRYSRSRATSIDLFVSELIAHSQHANFVIAEAAADPLPAPLLVEMPCYGFAKTLRRSKFIADAITRLAPHAVLVQQHMPSATMINAQVKQPVILQRHNFMERPSASDVLGRCSYRLKLNKVKSLSSADAAWRSMAEGERFLGFLTYFAERDVLSIKKMAELIIHDEDKVLVRYEDLLSGQIGEGLHAKLAKMSSELPERLVRALHSRINTPNPTYSPHHSDWQRVWDERAEAFFVGSGLKQLNNQLGYE